MGYIMSIMELVSFFPAQLRVAQLALLMKPFGGWMLIGVLCFMCRLRGRCRQCRALQWELKHQRSSYAGQSFVSASDAV
eukprot:6259711-Pyramimonas_sp.AAC.1